MSATQSDQPLTTLPHSSLAVPHTRYRVTITESMELSRGIAYTGNVYENGQLIGTFENRGCGGPTSVSIHAPYATAFNDYVAACRRDGQALADEFVVEALCEEYDFTKMIRAAARSGRSVIRGGEFDMDILRCHTVALVNDSQRAVVIETLKARTAPMTCSWRFWDLQDGRWVALVNAEDAPED